MDEPLTRILQLASKNLRRRVVKDVLRTPLPGADGSEETIVRDWKEVIRQDNAPMLYDFISSHRSEILEFCLLELKSKYPDRQDADLMSSIPQFVDEVVIALRVEASEDGKGAPPDIMKMTPAHGVQRRKHGFDISRLVHDFGLVCAAITTTVDRHHETPTSREYHTLNQCLDAGAALAVESFSNQMVADEHRKRTEHVGMLAHEIRNAVSNALIGFELIRRGRASVDGMTADVVQRSLSRIAGLASETLIAAQTGDSVVAQRQWLRLKDVFARVTKDLMVERGIRVNSAVDQELKVDADSDLLVSAFGNLLQNAVKFTHDNGTVELRADPVGRSIRIEVEDRCGGLPEGLAEDLFRPFVQRDPYHRGAGLGLAIARRAIEAHGGTLNVRNIPGVGCTFVAQLPQTTRVIDDE